MTLDLDRVVVSPATYRRTFRGTGMTTGAAGQPMKSA